MTISRFIPDVPYGVRSKTVLVIEDDPQLRELFAMLLYDAMLDVITAPKAEAAIDFVSDKRVDVAIVDVFMNGKGGLWAIEKLQQLHPEIRIIAISGGWSSIGADEVTRAASVVGAHRVLAKPFDNEALKDMVLELVGRSVSVEVAGPTYWRRRAN